MQIPSYTASKPSYLLLAVAGALAEGIKDNWYDLDTALEVAQHDGLHQLDYVTPGMDINSWLRMEHYYADEEDAHLLRYLIPLALDPYMHPRAIWRKAFAQAASAESAS